MDFNIIWKKIEENEGELFKTKTGLPFTYQISDGFLVTNRTNYLLAKSNFEKAAQIGELKNPGQINRLVRGPSYVYAILTDDRIRK